METSFLVCSTAFFSSWKSNSETMSNDDSFAMIKWLDWIFRFCGGF